MAGLTVTQLKKPIRKKSPYYIWHTGGRGFGRLGARIPKINPNALKTSKKSSVLFVFRYYVNKGTKEQFISIGHFPDISLEEAIGISSRYSSILKKGLNPKEELEKEKLAEEEKARKIEAQGSLSQLVDGYIERMAIEGKRTGEAVKKAIISDVYSVLDPMIKANQVTAQHIKIILSKMIQRGAIASSNKIRSYLHAAFNYGLKYDNDPMNHGTKTLFCLEYNPVSAVPKQTHAETVGDNWLNFNEVKTLINEESRVQFNPDTFILIKLCFYLGGQRPYEIFASKWDAVDLNNQTFEISKNISKNGRPNLLPLSSTACKLFEELHKISGNQIFLFPRATKSGHMHATYLSKAIQKYCKNTEFKKFIPRDIRRTCKTLMGEIGLSKEIRDRIQNHALNDVSSKHYDRYSYMKEKKAALEAWEIRLNASMESNVIQLTRKNYAQS